VLSCIQDPHLLPLHAVTPHHPSRALVFACSPPSPSAGGARLCDVLHLRTHHHPSSEWLKTVSAHTQLAIDLCSALQTLHTPRFPSRSALLSELLAAPPTAAEEKCGLAVVHCAITPTHCILNTAHRLQLASFGAARCVSLAPSPAATATATATAANSNAQPAKAVGSALPVAPALSAAAKLPAVEEEQPGAAPWAGVIFPAPPPPPPAVSVSALSVNVNAAPIGSLTPSLSMSPVSTPPLDAPENVRVRLRLLHL
jgi:hypothetical protein